MSKKSCNEIENGYKSDCSYSSTSNSDLDKPKKTLDRNIVLSEYQKCDSTRSRRFQTFRNRNKIKKMLDNKIDTSKTSLDEDLYGISDKYCKTLQELKTRLHNLNLDTHITSLETSKDKTNLKKSLYNKKVSSENEKKESNSNNDLKKHKYLFDKQTSTSKISSCGKINYTRKINQTKNNLVPSVLEKNITGVNDKLIFIQLSPDIDDTKLSLATDSNDLKTIIEPIEMYSSSTISSSDFYKETSCENPNFILKQSMLKNKRRKDYSCANIELCSAKTYRIKSPSQFLFKKNNLPIKKKLDNLQTAETIPIYSTPQSTKENSKLNTKSFNVNLPSSVGSDYTSSENFNLKSTTTIIDINTKPKRLYKKRNKIIPIPLSRSTSNTSLSDNTRNLDNLLLKYYKDTPEITSNPYSTPPPNISTCASGSSTGTTPRSNTSSVVKFQKLPIITTESSIVYSSRPIYTSIEAFSPIYSSSLDVPRKCTEIVDFPAITRITSFIHYPEGELDVIDNQHSVESNTSKISALAKKIKDEIYISSTSFKEQKHSFIIGNPSNINQTADRQSVNIMKYKPFQKQSKDFLFYDVLSTDSKNDEIEYKIEQSDLQSSSYSEDEHISKCNCFCNWMFPKRHERFFS